MISKCYFFASMLMAVCAASLPVITQAAEDRFVLPAVAADGLIATAEGWTLVRPVYATAAAPFSVEAEAASSRIRAGDTTGVRTNADGVVYLDEPPLFEIDVLADRTVTYAIYLRLRTHPQNYVAPRPNVKYSPTAATVTLDGKKIVTLPFDKVQKTWHWQQAGTVTLQAGMRRIRFQPLPGYQLDRIAFRPAAAASAGGPVLGAPAFAPPPGADDLLGNLLLDELEGTPVATPRAAPAATLTLAEIAPPAVEAWLRLEVDGDFDRCAWRLEVSTDGSKTWTPLPETDPLPVATGDGSDHLQARIVLTPERADARAVVKTAAAVWRPGPADLIPLEAGGLRLLCRRTDGSLNEILDAETGRRLGLPLPRPLFALGYRTADGKERTLQPHDFAPAVVTEPAGGATRRWRFAFAKEGEPLRVVVTLAAPETAGTPWQAHLTVTNVGDGTLLWSDFPRFSGLLPVSSALLPESLWHVSGKGIFPGNLSMGWGYLEQAGDSGRGWYLGCHTPGVAAVELVAQAAAPLAELGARHYAAAVPGAEIALSFAFAAGPADWHWAADIYGAWARDPLKPVTPPAWARMSDGWWSLGVDTEAGLLDRRSVTMFEDARWYGLPHLQLWVGSGDGQMCGRLSYLNPRLGTPEMSRADCRRIRDRGGHLGHYIQAREWGGAAFAESDRVGFTARSYFPDDVRIEDAAWSERFALQKGGECWIMCPAAPAWQDHIARDAGERVTLFGNDVAYIDQLGCTVMDCKNWGQENSVKTRRPVLDKNWGQENSVKTRRPVLDGGEGA